MGLTTMTTTVDCLQLASHQLRPVEKLETCLVCNLDPGTLAAPEVRTMSICEMRTESLGEFVLVNEFMTN
jgi:hypothetical protein